MRRTSRGFSLLEFMIVIAIIGALSAIATNALSRLAKSQSVDKTVLSVIALLNEARSQAVSSKNATSSGVRILRDKTISFTGSYGTNNRTYVIPSNIVISTSTGIGTDIIFANVSGLSSASGTITVQTTDASQSAVIRVFSSGAVEKQ